MKTGTDGLCVFMGAATVAVAILTIMEVAADETPAEQEEIEVVDSGDDPEVAVAPLFVNDLVGATELTQEQVDQMRAEGTGWGNIKVATRLAERIAADSGGALTFDDALAGVLADRAAGMGFGQIAGKHQLKVGQAVRNSNQRAKDALPDDDGSKIDGTDAGTADVELSGGSGPEESTERGFFGRFARYFRSDKPDRVKGPGKPNRPEKIEKSWKLEKPERPAKIARVQRPNKVERVGKPNRPVKPEKPNKGPKR